MKISVIVPVYKVEPYLDRCLNSLVNQSYRHLEIILVDDGSPDRCPQMCDDWAKRDSRIAVVHKKNEGLGLARNSGLHLASGDYISFIDSDDFLDTQAYETIASTLISEGSDVCFFSHCRLKRDGSLDVVKNTFPEKVSKDEIRTQLLPRCFGHSIRKPFDSFHIGSSCMGVYRKELLTAHRIRFRSERQFLCEDYLFAIEVCLHAASVSFINAPFYYYCENDSSLTLSYRTDRFEGAARLYKYMLSVIKTSNLCEESMLRAKDCFLINTIVCLKQELKSNNNPRRSTLQAIREICSSDITSEVTARYPVRQLSLKKMILVLALKHRKVYLLYLFTMLKVINS
jgi:glycosyltransferase involved in cell wall biosynthesis